MYLYTHTHIHILTHAPQIQMHIVSDFNVQQNKLYENNNYY